MTAPGIKSAMTTSTCIGLRINFTLPRILAVSFPKQGWVPQKRLLICMLCHTVAPVDVEIYLAHQLYSDWPLDAGTDRQQVEPRLGSANPPRICLRLEKGRQGLPW